MLYGSPAKTGASVPALVIGLPATGETKMFGIVKPTLVTPPPEDGAGIFFMMVVVTDLAAAFN